MNNTLSRITKRAKAIRKAHPSMQWKVALKKAAAEIKAGRKTVGKIAAPKGRSSSKPKKVVTTHSRQTTIGRMNISSLIIARKKQREAKEHFLKAAADLYARKLVAPKKSQRNKLQKQITLMARQIRKSIY